MKTTLLITSVFAVTLGLAQTPQGIQAESNLRALGEVGKANTIKTFNNRYEGVRGNPFLRDKWTKTEVVSSKGDTLFTLTKLNIYEHDVWAILSTGDSVIVDKGLIKSFSFVDPISKTQRTFEFIVDKQAGYFEVLYSGSSFRLLCRRKKEFIKAMTSGSYGTGNPYDEFVETKPQYFVIGNKPKLQRLKPTSEAVIAIFGPTAKTVMAEEKSDLKNEADLVALVKAIDQQQPKQ